MEKLELAAATTKDIETLRDGYRPVAKRGSILFFVLSDMAGVNSMYQYSLSSYLDVSHLALFIVEIFLQELSRGFILHKIVVERFILLHADIYLI